MRSRGVSFSRALPDPATQLAAHQVALRICSGPPIRYLLQHIVLLSGSVCRYRRVFLADLPFAQMIEAKIGDDAVDPGVEGALEAKTGDVFVCLQERFLINVLGLGVGAGQMHRQPEHRLVVVPYQLLEGGAIATLRFADQNCIVDAA